MSSPDSFQYISPSTSLTYSSVPTRSRADSNSGVALAAELPEESPLYIFGYGSLIWCPSFPSECHYSSYITGYRRRFWQGSQDHRGTAELPGRVVTLMPSKECMDIELEWEQKNGGKHKIVDTFEDDRVFGVTYQVAAADKLRVLHYLDEREKSGYSVQLVTVHIVPEYTDSLSAPVSPTLGSHHSNMKHIPSISHSMHTSISSPTFSTYIPPRTVTAIVYIGLNDNSDYLGPSSYPSMAQTIYTAVGPSGPNIVYFRNLYIFLKRNHLYDEHIELIQMEIEKIEDLLKENNNSYTTMLPLPVATV